MNLILDTTIGKNSMGGNIGEILLPDVGLHLTLVF